MKPSSKKYIVLFLLWVVVIFLLTSIPSAGSVSPFPHFDKLAHFAVYMIAALLFSRFLREEGKRRLAIVLLTLLVIGLIGGADELHQKWITNRVCSPLDWFADLGGGAAGAALTAFFNPPTRKSAETNNE